MSAPHRARISVISCSETYTNRGTGKLSVRSAFLLERPGSRRSDFFLLDGSADLMSARDIIALCQRHLPKFGSDCSGFVKAVANDCGILLIGSANDIVKQIAGSWQYVDDGIQARAAAARGLLVVAGATARGHGHVVIVVDGPLSRPHPQRFPYCFWGSYHAMQILGETVNVGFSRGHGCLNYAFGPDSRNKVIYRAAMPLELLTPKASGLEGVLIHTWT